jgi:hypothetical protein
MIGLAVGLGVLGIFALRRARRRCYGGGYRGYGWHGPWASSEGCGDGDCDEHGHHGHHMRHGWRGRRGRWGRRWMLHRAFDRIDATPAQERVIVGEIEKLQEKLRDARGGLKDGRADLAAALRGPTLDDAALGAVLGRVDGATGEARAAVLDAVRNIHGVLDDKQRGLLADMLERRRHRGGGGAGSGGTFRTGPYR